MRPVLPGDLNAAARALLTVPPGARRILARRLLAQADAADRYRIRKGHAHPFWGNGSLQSAALGRQVGAERRADDPDYIDCQIVILEALRDRFQPEAQSTQRRAVGSSSRRFAGMHSPQSSQ